MSRHLAASAAIVVVGMLASGCSGASAPTVSSTGSAAPATSPAAATSSVIATSATPAATVAAWRRDPAWKPDPALTKRFGETYTYPDGVTLTVGPPQPFTPTPNEAAFDSRETTFVLFAATVTNPGSKPLTGLDMDFVVLTGGKLAGRVEDARQGLADRVDTLAPGQTVTLKVAKAVDAGQPLLLHIRSLNDRPRPSWTS